MKLLLRLVMLQQFLWGLLVLLGEWEDVVPKLDTMVENTNDDYADTTSRTQNNNFPIHWDPAKPSLIFHIGPSKTATTSIQKESLTFTESLEADNYVYLGRYANPKLREPAKIGALIFRDPCFQQASEDWTKNRTTDFRGTPCWKERIQVLDEYRKNGTSIVISDEAYSYLLRYQQNWDQHHFQMLRTAFRDWNVLVVATYRRYYEWILSVPKERNSKHCLHPNAPWPRDGGKACDNLWKTVQGQVNAPDYRGTVYANLDVTIPAWESGGFDTRVLDFHNERHITCSFYCDIVPNTPHTCQHCLQTATKGMFNAKPASMTAYSDIVFAAAEQGLISMEQQQRMPIYNMTMALAAQHHFAGFDHLPIQCPSEAKLNKLLEKSLAFERLILPDLAESIASQHRDKFWESRREYCHVDTAKVLDGKSNWQEVVRSLTATTEWTVEYF